MDDNLKNKPDLPENAKCIFRGVIYDVYQWKQEMFDGSLADFEKIKRADTATIIAVAGNKIILEEQEQPHKGKFLALPGGRCDEREKTIETASRELLEETGYSSDDVFLWKRIRPVKMIIWESDFFIARNCRKIQEPELDNGEKISLKLISFDELLDLAEDENFRHKDLQFELLRMKLHPEYRDEFKKILFSKK